MPKTTLRERFEEIRETIKKLFRNRRKEKILAVMDRRIGAWLDVQSSGWGRIQPPHDHLWVSDELIAMRNQVKDLL